MILRLSFYLILSAAAGFGQNCVKYGAPTTLTGTLFLRDEAGYNQFIALRSAAAFCAAGDPKDVGDATDPYYRTQNSIREVEAGVYGGDLPSAALRDRLNRLIGHRVVIKGDLFPATTGYDRTNVVLRVYAVNPTDPSGSQALLTPKTQTTVKDVDAYEVTITARKRLVIEAHEIGSTNPLVPSDLYLTHWMTGGEVVYIDCRDGYERSLVSTTQTDGAICFDGDGLCGFSAFPKNSVIIKLRCTRKR